MKKFLAILAVAALMIGFSASAMAAGSPVAPVAPVAVAPVAAPAYSAPAAEDPCAPGRDVKVKITPVTDAKKGTTEEDKAIVEAYDNIKDAKSLKALIPGLESAVAAFDSSLDADKLVVHDLFGISVLVDDVETYFVNGEKVRFSVKADLKPDDVLVVAQYIEGEWVILRPCRVIINDDKTVTLNVTSTVPTVFLTKVA